MFQISKPYLPNQFLQLNKKEMTFPGKTHQIPSIWNRTPHKAKVMSQWIKRWSIDSPLLQHIQHQLTNGRPHLVRLSKLRIFPSATVHKKNNTLLGTLTDQIPFQGKGAEVAPPHPQEPENT